MKFKYDASAQGARLTVQRSARELQKEPSQLFGLVPCALRL